MGRSVKFAIARNFQSKSRFYIVRRFGQNSARPILSWWRAPTMKNSTVSNIFLAGIASLALICMPTPSLAQHGGGGHGGGGGGGHMGGGGGGFHGGGGGFGGGYRGSSGGYGGGYHGGGAYGGRGYGGYHGGGYAGRVTAAITEAVPMVAVVTAADLPDAATAAPLAPVAALQPGPGRGRVVAVDLPETSHLTQPPPTEIGTLLEAPAAHL